MLLSNQKFSTRIIIWNNTTNKKGICIDTSEHSRRL